MAEDPIVFLEAWQPDGPWLLTAIEPENKDIETRFFDDRETMRSWIASHQGRRNLYFSVNQPKPGHKARAKKTDIAALIALHVDVDPPKTPGLDLAAVQAAILDRLKAHQPPPSVIVFSGGGYQGFWRLDEPVAVDGNIGELEAYNIALEQQLGGDHCHNIDRIMRVPGTLNLPDAKKRAAGRVETPAALVYFDPNRVYSLADFTPYQPTGTGAGGATAGDTTTTATPDVPDPGPWLRDLIRLGHPADKPDQWGGDRSKAVWAAVCGLVKAYWTDTQIVTALTDPANGISAHILEKTNAADYARQTVVRARETVAKDEAGGGKPEPEPEPLYVVNPASWQDKPVPERRWIVPDWIPSGVVTGLYGPPGLGKTLIIQQLMTARGLGKPWLGCPLAQGRTIGFLCEDDEDELHRRQEMINQFYGCDYRDLSQFVRFVPRLGHDNILMSFRDGRPSLTPFYDQALDEARAFGADLVVFDTVADTFGGNQNDMGHARQMVQFGYGSFARALGGAVLASAHPSQSGKSTGSGESGSVQWDAAFRSRAYLTIPNGNDETPSEDARILTRKKANYASRNETIELIWKDGVLVALRAPTGIFASIERKTCERVVLELVEKMAQENQWVSINNKAGNYAPRVFVRRPENREHGYKVADFERAIQDLLARGELVNQAYGRRGDERYRLILANGHDR